MRDIVTMIIAIPVEDLAHRLVGLRVGAIETGGGSPGQTFLPLSLHVAETL